MHIVPEAVRHRVFRGSEVRAAGLLTRRQLQSNAYVRLRQNIYADAALDIDSRARSVAAALIAPPGYYLTTSSAAAFIGVSTTFVGESTWEQREPPVIAVPEGIRWRCPGIRIVRGSHRPGTYYAAVPLLLWAARPVITVATPTQAAVDALLYSPKMQACILVDGLLASRRTTIPAIRRVLEAGRGRYVARALHALAYCDDRAESSPESRLRIMLVEAGLPRPVPQFVVRDGNDCFVARVDLAWPGLRLAVEYDGRWHGDAAQLVRDRRRLNALVAAGWTVLHVTAEMMRDPVALIAMIATAIARAAA